MPFKGLLHTTQIRKEKKRKEKKRKEEKRREEKRREEKNNCAAGQSSMSTSILIGLSLDTDWTSG